MSIIRIGILTISDRSARGKRPDATGPALREAVQALGPDFQVAQTAVVPDELPEVAAILRAWSDDLVLDVILTAGGTGLAPRDITPEATRSVIDREAPGLAEAMRAASLRITPHAMLSRAIAGVRRRTLIINLPGSPKGAVENLQTIQPVLAHAAELLRDAPDAEKHH